MLRIENYSLSLKDSDGKVLPILEDITLELSRGTCLGLAGESGSGKSMLACSILGLVPSESVAIRSGKIIFTGQDLLRISESEFRKIRGKRISMIFQEPMAAMNPMMTIRSQIDEMIATHEPSCTASEISEAVKRALSSAGFSDPLKYWNSYPHQLSGGMRQRAMAAMAIALEPELILADEPTTALDAALQIGLLREFRTLIGNNERSMIFISHDLGVLREISDRIAVLYAGNLLETGNSREILENPAHPYTRALVNSLPRLINERKLPQPIAGGLPKPDQKPKGCVFEPRCPQSAQKCRECRPKLLETASGHYVKCFFPGAWQ